MAQDCLPDETMSSYWAGLSFSSLGLLTGLLTGMSASAVVTTVLGSIFGLLGGSFVAFIQKLSLKQQELAAKSLFALSLSCMVGVVGGVLLSEYHILSPKGTNASEVGEPKYLKALEIKTIDSIDNRRRQGEFTSEEAYSELKRYATEHAR